MSAPTVFTFIVAIIIVDFYEAVVGQSSTVTLLDGWDILNLAVPVCRGERLLEHIFWMARTTPGSKDWWYSQRWINTFKVPVKPAHRTRNNHAAFRGTLLAMMTQDRRISISDSIKVERFLSPLLVGSIKPAELMN